MKYTIRFVLFEMSNIELHLANYFCFLDVFSKCFGLLDCSF